MPKPKDPESYEVAGTPYKQHEDPIAVLGQAFADYRTQVPARNFTKRVQGNQVTIYCHAHERGLGDPGRRALQADAMKKATAKFVSGLKKHHREISGKTLALKMVKGSEGYDLQQASLNDRWEMVFRCTYEVDLIRNPED